MGIRAWKSRICSFSLFPLQVYVRKPSHGARAIKAARSPRVWLGRVTVPSCATRLGHPRWGVLSTGCACPYSLSHSQHLSHLRLGMLHSSPAFRRLWGRLEWPAMAERVLGVASVPRDMALLEAERYGWRYPVHKSRE